MAFGGKQFHCQMSCDHELANEWARCSGKNASYITKISCQKEPSNSTCLVDANKSLKLSFILNCVLKHANDLKTISN